MDYAEHIGMLSNEEAGKLMKAIFACAEGREPPEPLDGMTKMAFSFISSQLIRDLQKYEAVCKARREASRKAAEARQHSGTLNL